MSARRVICVSLLPLLLAGCSMLGIGGLSGKYLVAGTTTYGYDFQGDTVYSLGGDTIGKGTYTVDGTTVRICFSFMCNDLTIVGDCLVDDGEYAGSYCKP